MPIHKNKNREESSVYFADCYTVDGLRMNLVKIGWSIRPEKRVVDVSAYVPFECRLICAIPGDYFLEQFLHSWLKNHLIAGEFFRASDDVMRLVNYAKENGRLPFPITFDGDPYWYHAKSIAPFMRRTGVTVQQVAEWIGRKEDFAENVLTQGTARAVAAATVCAIRNGYSVTWPADIYARGRPAQHITKKQRVENFRNMMASF